MRRLWFMMLVAALAACGSRAPEDLTGSYTKPNGIAFKVEAAANGDARVTAGDQVMIRKSGVEYLLQSDAQGRYAVTVGDYLAVLDEARATGPFAGGPRPQPDYVTVAGDAATIAGLRGTIWKVHPKDIPSLPAVDAVISDDPALAGLGKGVAMQAKLLIERNSRSLGAKPGKLERAMIALYDKGAVLRFGQVFALERVERGPIAARAFDLPPVLDRAALKARMTPR